MCMYIYNGILAVKKNEIMPFVATRMDPEITILNKVSQNEKDKYHDITYMWNLKYDTNEHIYKTKTDLQIKRTDLLLPGGSRMGKGS